VGIKFVILVFLCFIGQPGFEHQTMLGLYSLAMSRKILAIFTSQGERDGKPNAEFKGKDKYLQEKRRLFQSSLIECLVRRGGIFFHSYLAGKKLMLLELRYTPGPPPPQVSYPLCPTTDCYWSCRRLLIYYYICHHLGHT
jgi:hypothetical protein